ncbi:MAG: hypothetical protein CMG74_09795 [Candidatus Marinimicrobia bacterium]|nr:hypothetical protein [Candidatus Neomarinimicrobiota bacterium]|tara:strand:- start:343 stop:1230 length:888 start_codon:yes stop_codon:yes gene_type:complete
MNSEFSSYTVSIISVCLCSLVGVACSQGGVQSGGYPILFICLIITFLLQWLIFIPSFLWETERFYDLTGSFTFLLITNTALHFKSNIHGTGADTRSIILCALVSIWALRLGGFLLMRVYRVGEDRRFRDWKKSFPLFFRTWTLQGMWVFITPLTALTAITSPKITSIDWTLYLGSLVWLCGFVTEVVADIQKSRFKSDEKNKNKFIKSGLWSISRHPNYLGEIILWIGISIISFPVLAGWQYLSLISPVFVYLLLTKVSGIPILESNAEKKWGKGKDYQAYIKNTPRLFPKRVNI